MQQQVKQEEASACSISEKDVVDASWCCVLCAAGLGLVSQSFECTRRNEGSEERGEKRVTCR